MRVVEFGKVSTKTQTTIAHNYFYELCKENNTNIEPDQNILQEIVNQNNHPGVRIMKDIIYKYFSHIFIEDLLGEDKTTFDVEAAYSQYKDQHESKGENITINNIQFLEQRYFNNLQ